MQTPRRIARRRIIGLLTVCAILLNSVLVPTAYCGSIDCPADQVASAEDSATPPKSCCSAKCCGCCGCCSQAEPEHETSDVTVCQCGIPADLPASPSQEPVRAPVRLASLVSHVFGDIAEKERQSLGTSLIDAAAIPMLRGGVQTHFCVWVV